jgi:predicted transposase
MPLPITLSFKLSFETKEEREKVIKLMRLWSSAICFIHNRLKEGKTDNEIYKLTQEKFNSFGRNSERGRVAVPFPILGRTPSKGLSPLKPVLVGGMLDRSQEQVSSCRSCRGRELNN